jgi:hypothetical protein
VSETPERIRKHVAALEEFEQKFGEWITGLHNEQVEGEPAWSKRERAERERELRELATPADRAMKASGVGQIALTFPPAIGGGVMAGDLPSQVFYSGPVGFSANNDGLDLQRSILERIPSQLSGLRMRLEDAEESRPEPQLASVGSSRRSRWAWINHPWTIAIGAVLLGALITIVLHL